MTELARSPFGAATGVEIDVPDGPHCVYRWRRALAHRIGLSPAEIDDRVAALDAYCAQRGITPDRLLWTWEDRPDLTLRRHTGVAGVPNLAVESFLIHNGVNVFGEIVCVAGRPEDLAQQGPQFVPDP